MTILSPHQQRVIDELIQVAEIATDGSRKGLVVTPRVQSLVIGPSGSGKSFVAVDIATKLNLPHLKINVGSWILMASRAGPSSWSVIADWLANLPTGGVIIIDEIDKLTSNLEYTTALKLEIHDLLDGQIPPSLTTPREKDDEVWDIPAPDRQQIDRTKLEKILKERVMIIGCGAFQGAWLANSKQMGFGAESTQLAQSSPTREQILSSIDPELRQRFRDEISILPMMTATDYMTVANELAKQIPPEYLPAWQAHLGGIIKQALEGNLGMRALEELMLRAMILTKTKSPLPLRKDPQQPRYPDAEREIW